MLALLQRLVDVRREEIPLLGWTWLYYYAVLAAYYVLRPIRDEAGVASGVDNLPWLFTATLAAMIVANPLFGALVSRLTRVQFVSWTYRFFALNLIVFFVLLKVATPEQNVWMGRAFFNWTAVFNLFVPSVFWAFMTDLFTPEQAKRLFGPISAAGTLGAMSGAALTAVLVQWVPGMYLLFLSVALLELAVLAVRRLSRLSSALTESGTRQGGEQVIGGSALAGVRQALSSPYLLGISGYMLLYTILSTFLYVQQAAIVDQTFASRAARTAFFAQVDVVTNLIALVLQMFAVSNIIRVLGVALTLGLLPTLTAFGFTTLGLMPTAAVVVAFQALRRAGNFAVARPTREVLFTVLSREDRYKAKSFIDTFVYRTGDQIGVWVQPAIAMLGLGLAATAWVAVPLSLLWLANGVWLGYRQESLAAPVPDPVVPGAGSLDPATPAA